MRVIFSTSPQPRLLNSAVEEPREAPPEKVDVPVTAKDSSSSSGNGRAVFVRIVLGVLALVALFVIYGRNQTSHSSAGAARGFITVDTPGARDVQITPAMIHVSAISLGHPRLALVNGQQVSEGDQVTLRLTSPEAVVKLEVLKIADGQVELGEGTQVLTVHVEAPGAKKANRP